MKLRLAIDTVVHETTNNPQAIKNWHAEYFAKKCIDGQQRCPIGDIFCPFDKPCAEVTSDDWHEIMEVVI